MSPTAKGDTGKASADSESPVVLHHGRGGAGNVIKADLAKARRASHTADVHPTVTARRFSTGIGGSGNMARHDVSQPDETRAYQDINMSGIVMPQSGFHTGRAGFGNAYRPTEEEVAEARENNEQMRRKSAASRGSGDEAEPSAGRRSSIVNVLRKFSLA